MNKFYIAFTYKFYIAFTYRYGERLTVPLLYVVRRPPSFWTGADRRGSWLTAEQAGTGDILEPRLTLLLLSVLLSHPLVMLQLYFLLLLDIHQLWVQLPFPQQVTSEPSHCPPLCLYPSSRDRTFCQWNDEKISFIFIHRRKMNNLFLFFPPLLFNIMAKPTGCTCIPALHAEPIKILTSYTARLEEIRTIRLAPCHQFWLYTPFHN